MRKKIFIIHGKSITFQEALIKVIEVVKTKINFFQKKYYIEKELSRFIRYIIYEKTDNSFIKQLERLFVIKLLISPFYVEESFAPSEKTVALSDFKIKQKLEEYKIDVFKIDSKEFCDDLFKVTLKDFAGLVGCPNYDLDSIISYLDYFSKLIGNNTDGKYFERNAGDAIVNSINENKGNGKEVIKALIEIKRNNEIGGDLDTIGSNTLYGYWALYQIQKEIGEPAVYGKHFEFDFVNYHEGLANLNLKHSNCDIYLPDFPCEAIPDLEGDIELLLQNNNFLVRIDDHHPISKETKAMLDKLLLDNKIGHYAMSGGVGGEEIPKDKQSCGTDLIYSGLIKDTELDNELWKEFTRLAHVQDLHIEEDKMAIDLSKLIGSKHSKLDMVQQLMLMQNIEDLNNILETTGWNKKIKHYENELERLCPNLENDMGLIQFVTPLTKKNRNQYFETLSSGKQKIVKFISLISLGLIDMTSFYHKYDSSTQHNILVLLSPFQSQKESKINVASAINYFKDKFKFDYIFFCYGLSLMTTRKVNGEDLALDLNVLAGKIGTEEDGGHAEAATCKPSSNKHFPKDKFPRMNSKYFDEYVKYLGFRISKEFGYQLVRADKMPRGFYKKNN